MAVRLGKRPPATKSMAETTRAKPRLSRIQWSKCEELGWSELAGIELVAVAGVQTEREKGYGARQGEEVRALGSWGCTECGGALGRVLARP